jgi:integrase
VGCNRSRQPRAPRAPVARGDRRRVRSKVRFKAPKTEKSRRDVALTSGAIEALAFAARAAIEVTLHVSGPFGNERLVFPDPRTGEPWKPDTFSNEFLRAVEASGLRQVSFYGLRHSYASISLRAGTPLKVVSENARSHNNGGHCGPLHAGAWRPQSISR